jgi:uncharacterized protein YndB with AHSA1/START domain
MSTRDGIRLERTYDAPAEKVWELWTTPAGIESWWAPDGFEVQVQKLDLKPGGELIYTMTATAPEQIEFMRNAGMPLTTESRKTYTEISEPRRLAYSSHADFIPDTEPYEFLTTVELTPTDGQVTVTMIVERMHDQVWTERLIAGRNNELDNLAKAIAARR